jgi:Ran GTPase-activating protein (RanGAP) involved in mRNA processing and transport
LIARALIKNATLLYLNLENCDITSASARDMQRCFSSMKVLSDLNLSRNYLGNFGGQALANALISNSNSVLWRINLSRCGIEPEGSRHFFSTMRHNKKLIHLIYDYNFFDLEVERLSPVMTEFFMMNKTLLNLSFEGCGFNR